MTDTQKIRLGTRGSDLARWQTDYVAARLQEAYPNLETEIKVISTKGDRVLDTPLPLVGGKGVFTAELETALHSGEIDIAVHSLKDLPTENPQGLTIGAIPVRADPADVLVSRAKYSLDTLPNGAAIGTSSHRRAAQLLHHRPDLKILDIRGNIDTRVRKALNPDGPYDAILLAKAGLTRLKMDHCISQTLSDGYMMPAPGQGALGIQCRDEQESIALLGPIHDRSTAIAVSAERAFLAGLGGGCSVPVAAHAYPRQNGTFVLKGRVCSLDGNRQIDVEISFEGDWEHQAKEAGRNLAQQAIEQGADQILRGNPMTSLLDGIGIVNTRAIHQAPEFDNLIRSRGGVPLSYPCIAIKPPDDTSDLDSAIERLLNGYFDWLVLTSANTVWSIAQRLDELHIKFTADPGFRTAAIGSSTKQAVQNYLKLNVDLTPDEFIAESLADVVIAQNGRRIFLPISSIARPTLAQKLSDHDTEVHTVTAYQTIKGSGGIDLPTRLLRNEPTVITFTSSSTVTYFVQRLIEEGGTDIQLKNLCVASIGPKTSKTAQENGLVVGIEAEHYTLEGILNGIETHFKLTGACMPYDRN